MIKVCEKCNKEFSLSLYIENKRHNLQSRRFCLECNPFKSGKRKNLCNIKPVYLKGNILHRICTGCKEEKTIDNFYPIHKINSYHPKCKKCMIEIVCSKQRKIKQSLVDLKGGKCQKCGYNRCLAALEFHHLDPSKKEIKISDFKNCKISDKRLTELEKCSLLCSNCHRENHAMGPESLADSSID